MKRPCLRAFWVSLVAVVVAGLLLGSIGQARKSRAQDADKSLDIERYPNEPLELVDLKVGEQVIKVETATRSKPNDTGLDHLSFKERDGWFKRVVVRLRNVSGRPIYGASAHLYFQPSHTRTLYSLPLAGSTLLKRGVLEPGAEITFVVSDQAWSLTADILNQHGVDPDLAPVKFSIDIVRFSDDLQWSRGNLLRRDPDDPNRWNVIEMKVAP
jgi:hypothetical protein